MRTIKALAVASLFGSVALACSAAPDSGQSLTGTAAPVSTDPSPNPTSPNIKPPTTAADAGSAAMAQCATSSAKPTLIPVSLVFIFDKSGSMADDSKWTSCQQGLTTFFADNNSNGLNASLQFFPLANECSTAGYQKPAVSMRALPNANDFNDAMGAVSPLGGTPTLPALKGALAYAEDVQSSSIGKVAVVLVTDGQPNDCSSTLSSVSDEAATGLANGVSTYVIGVGNTGNLNAIAAAGGTSQATIVDTNDASQTAQDFQSALEAVRGSAVACDYAIPTLPKDATLDQVNVVFTPSNGSAQTLTYDANCKNANAWHYDDPKNPTEISLCKSTCDQVQKDQSGTIDLVFGCSTQGGVPN